LSARGKGLAAGVILWYYLGMKAAISVPDKLFKSGEKLAKQMGVTRSKLYAIALSEYVAKRRYANLTERLNEVYSKVDSSMDPVLAEMQARTIAKEPW